MNFPRVADDFYHTDFYKSLVYSSRDRYFKSFKHKSLNSALVFGL